ncbi:hypothetical protein DW726_05095 [Streptococcus gordonii]|uniref:hypothetical protein n=1 Tax=Streptococcus gordonii TaxID=1302 RepID=UPI000E511466|nr:hypothetical protein [Streptococcus gordonii]RHE64467.1 hypothetical protein DW726_05095 [Streptococcus gordonii]
MSSEQQERMAVQYAERSFLFTVKTLLKILEWSRKNALAQDSAYKIGVQKLEELLQSPYSVDTINLKKDFLDKPIDIEKFRSFLEKEELPLALAWQGDSLHFYTKDRSILDNHLENLLQKMVADPEKLEDLTIDKSIDEAIDEAKTQIKVVEPSNVKTKEMVR